jgi:hypothetical protein
MTPMSDEHEQGGLSRLISLQATSLGALTLSAFLLLKCYAVAHYSLTTAAALVTASPLSVLLGSVMLYMYQFLPLLGLAALYTVVQILTHDVNGKAIIVCTALAAVGVTALALSPLYYIAWAGGPPVVIVLASWAVWRIRHRHRSPDTSTENGSPEASRHGRARAVLTRPILVLHPLEWIAVYFVLYAAAVVALTLDTMWVPTEVVSLDRSDGQYFVVGNVLSDDGRWVTILRSADHGLSRYPAGQVQARTLCHMRGSQPRHRGPLIDLLLHNSHPSPNKQCVNVLRNFDATESQILPGSLPTAMLDTLR